jgi:uncharacterized protein YndB with AHSA1/START domain
MGECTFEHSGVTRAPRAEVWAYWTDLRNHARLEPGVERIELDGPFVAGTTGRTVVAGFTQEWQLTDVVEGRRFAITGFTPDGAGALHFAWAFDDEGAGTRLTQRIRASGPDVEAHLETFRQMEDGARAGMARLAADPDRLAGAGGPVPPGA